jgi:hypothetical protein
MRFSNPEWGVGFSPRAASAALPIRCGLLERSSGAPACQGVEKLAFGLHVFPLTYGRVSQKPAPDFSPAVRGSSRAQAPRGLKPTPHHICVHTSSRGVRNAGS